MEDQRRKKLGYRDDYIKEQKNDYMKEQSGFFTIIKQHFSCKCTVHASTFMASN